MKHYYSALKKNLIHVDKIEKETQRLTEKNKNCYRDHHARLLSCTTPTKLKNLSTKDEYLAELLKFRTMITKILLFSFYYGKRSVANQNLKSLAYSASSLFQYDQRFDFAADYFIGLEIVDPITFYADLEHYAGNAFTISNIFQIDSIRDIQQDIASRLDSGLLDPRDLKKSIQETIVSRGEAPLNPFHLETVVRTNINSAFSHGRYVHQLQSTNIYWQYIATVDGRETPLCYSLDGSIFKRSDPFWSMYYPPNHFNCRSTVISMAADEVEDHKIKDGENELKKAREKYPKLAKEIKAGKGFDLNPADQLNQYLQSKAGSLGTTNYKPMNPPAESITQRRLINSIARWNFVPYRDEATKLINSVDAFRLNEIYTIYRLSEMSAMEFSEFAELFYI